MKLGGSWRSLLMLLVALTIVVSAVACKSETPAPAPAPTAAPAPAKPAPTAAPAPARSAPKAAPAGPAIVPVAQPMTLKMGSPFPPPPATMSMGIDYFQKQITERTGGKITFENFWGASLVSPLEVLDAVGKGVVDMTPGVWLYAPGKVPLGTFEYAFAFRPSDHDMLVKAKRSMYDAMPAMHQELTEQNTKLLWLQGLLSYDIESNVAIPTLNDMKGKKLAVIGTEFPKWVEAAGAAPVTMPAGDRYVALQRGTFDGQIIDMSVFGDLKNYEVSKHYTYTNLGSAVPLGGWMNLDLFNSFSPELQALFDEVSMETEQYHIDLLTSRKQGYIDTLTKAGVTFYTMPQADLDRWAQLMPDMPAVFAEKVTKLGWPGWEVVDTFMKMTTDAGHKWPRQWGER